MKLLAYISIFISILFACSSSEKSNDTSEKKEKIRTTDNDTIVSEVVADTIEIETPFVEADPLKRLKNIIRAELKDKSLDSVIIVNADTINAYKYIKGVFSTDKIKSIEFFGSFGRYYRSPGYQPLGSLLVIDYPNKSVAKQELDSLHTNWKQNAREIEAMVKAGGIAFQIDNKLCMYSVNTCGPGYKNLLRIDAIIAEKVFQNTPFTRLHAGCGMGPFKKIRK